MTKRSISNRTLIAAKELCADFEEDLAKQEKFQRWQMSEYEKLSKQFGNIKIDFQPGTINPIRIDIGRESFKFNDFQSYVERKLRDVENLKKTLQYCKSIQGKINKIAFADFEKFK